MVQRKIKKRIRKCGRDPSQPHHTAPGAEATPKTLAPFSPGLRASATSGPPAAMSWARVRVLEGTGADSRVEGRTDAPLRARAARVSAAARALLSAPAAACSPGRALGLGVGSARLRPPRRAPRPPSPWRLRGRRSRRWSRARGGRQRRRESSTARRWQLQEPAGDACRAPGGEWGARCVREDVGAVGCPALHFGAGCVCSGEPRGPRPASCHRCQRGAASSGDPGWRGSGSWGAAGSGRWQEHRLQVDGRTDARG